MSKYKIRSLNDIVKEKMRITKYWKKGVNYIPISFGIKHNPEILKIINRWTNRVYDLKAKMIVVAAPIQFEDTLNNLSNISEYTRKAIISYDSYLSEVFEETLFWDKAEFIRSAFIFYTIIKKEKKDKEIEDQSDPNKIIIDNKELSVLRVA